MQTQIKSWGNSQAVRLTKELLETAGIGTGDYVDIIATEGEITIKKQSRHITLRERAAEYNGYLNLDNDFDWGEPQGKELW